MVSGLLFKWEDSPALSHHCGFCERPLSHPGARSSCFGDHAEPCHRFHQAMFMRLRSHTCHYCRTIDEAHHRRHKKIAEGIRDVYESCGLEDWTIIPSEPEERGRTRGQDPSSDRCDDTGRTLSTEDTPASKREKKDAKALARAASRTRVISQEEIAHVESVLHSAEGFSNSNSDGPRNTEEMEEIERHLKYNAHVYNSQPDRRELKRYARLPDVDVDFDAEMERIFEAFRVTELLKKNTRNRGLQGKELKTFQALVEELKKAVVDDLVLVKRDALETRMRRAGYLRYTNKTAHNIIEDRYTDKDWKTGEKYAAIASDSSGIISPAEECGSSSSTQSGSSPILPPATPQQGPDRRHLQQVHMRVSGDNGLGEKVIEPYNTPLLPMNAASASKKPAVQLKVVVPGTVHIGSTSKKPSQPNNGTWNTVISGKKPKVPSVKPAWGMTATGRLVMPPPRPTNPWGPDACEIPDLRSIRAAPAVQPPAPSSVTISSGPDGFEEPGATAAEEPSVSHVAVSQKKAKKYEREARRKAKKMVEQYEETATVDVALSDGATTTQPGCKPSVDDSTYLDVTSENIPFCESSPGSASISTVVEAVMTPVAAQSPSELCEALLDSLVPAPLRTVHNSKHTHWTRFDRQFIVDQLTGPSFSFDSGCTHLNTCLFKTADEIDCPFCMTDCSCSDPFADPCYLVYPCNNVLVSGPYNRLRGEKLLAMYQQEENFKDRIMLADDDLVDYFKLDPKMRGNEVPKRLATEHTNYAVGYCTGPLMEQEKLFERLWNKNNILKRKISRDMLVKVQHDKLEVTGRPYMCYCHGDLPEAGLPKDVVECAHRDCSTKYFHKACVEKFLDKKLSRWYCYKCSQDMRALAYQTLRDLGYDDIPDEEAELNDSMELLQGIMAMPDGMIDSLRARMGKMGSGAKVAGAIAMAMDRMI